MKLAQYPRVQGEMIFGCMWSKVVIEIDIWDRLERQLCLHAPHLMTCFSSAVSESIFFEFEEKIGHHLPDDVRAAYLHHNGCTQTVNGKVNLFGDIRWLSLSSVFTCHRDLTEPIDGLSMTDICTFDELDPLWNEVPIRPFELVPDKWIQIGRGSETALYIDMIPGPKGTEGQLIGQSWTGGSNSIWVIASSLDTYLFDLVCGLESGQIAALTVENTENQYWGYKADGREFAASGYKHVYPLI
jgi:cell wall assembly regulator SMI1